MSEWAFPTPERDRDDELAREYWRGYHDGHEDGLNDRRERGDDDPPEALPAGPDYPSST